MKLSPSLIRQHLKGIYSLDEEHYLTEERSYFRPLFYPSLSFSTTIL